MTTNTVTRTSGGQPGNRNATRHGLRMSGLPDGCSYIESQLTAFRRYIREELAERRELTLFNEAILQSAVRHEQRALLVGRWLRLEADKLSVDQRAGLLRDLSNATDARDRCLKQLKLHKEASANIIDTLYGPHVDEQDERSATEATEETRDAENASEGQSEA